VGGVHFLKEMPGWVIAQLERWKKVIKVIEEPSVNCSRGQSGGPHADLCRGELTHELIDPKRFRNSRQVAQLVWALPDTVAERDKNSICRLRVLVPLPDPNKS
jgi:hypothetical protein